METEAFELHQRQPSNRSSVQVPITETTNPPHQEPESTTATFHELLVTNTSLLNLSLSLPSPSSTQAPKPLFTVQNSIYTPSKPSVTLLSHPHQKVLGVAKLGCFQKHNIIGIGDPKLAEIGEGKEMVWEKLEKSSTWTHGNYEVVWKGRRYEWRRTKRGWVSGQEELEMREVVGDELGMGRGEVLAYYRPVYGVRWTKRGSLFLRARGEQGLDWEGGGIEGREWEVMILVSALALIEGARRRARRRRKM